MKICIKDAEITATGTCETSKIIVNNYSIGIAIS